MKKLSSLFCIFAFSFVLSVSVFATSSNGISWNSQPVPVLSNPTDNLVINNGLPVYSSGDVVLYVTTSYSGSNVFVWAEYGNPNEINGYRVVLDEINATHYDLQLLIRYCLFNTESSTIISSGYFTLTSPLAYQNFSWWHVDSISGVSTLSSDSLVPIYSSASSVVSDLRSYSDSVSPPVIDPDSVVPPQSFVDIPSGYVAVLRAKNPSGYSAASFRTTFNWWSSPSQPFWGNTGHSYKFFDSRPTFTGSTLFPLGGSTSFSWQKYGRQTGFGGGVKDAYYDISLGNTYHWIVIYNPFYTFDSSSESDVKYNSTVRAFAQIAEVYLYPVSQLLDSDGWTGRSLQDWENPYVGVAPEEDRDTWTFVQDSTTDPGTTVPSVPEPGGDNIVPVQVTLPEIILKFGDLLSGFFDDLLSLFGKGEEAIIALIGIAAPFFSLIGMIFTWLPTDIVAFITAAITATVFLGLLKHFL